MNRRHFEGFDAIRFYAAISVLVFHAGIGGLYPALVNLFLLDGLDAVTLFFVLSGFLITYLLLEERRAFDTVDIPAFYVRRALRIWPLYFLVLIFTIVCVQPVPLPVAIGTAFFAGNFVLPMSNFNISPIYQFWSLGVEEQFYLVWPWAFKRCSNRQIVGLLVAVVILRPLLAALAVRFGTPYLALVVNLARYDAMALGALAAFALNANLPLLRVVYRLEGFWWILVGVIVVIPGVGHPAYVDTIFAALFACWLLCVGTKPQPKLRLPSMPLLGNLSYGIYLWHFPLYALIVRAIPDYFPLVLVTLACTLVLAYGSHVLIERPILRLKSRFQPRPALVPSAAAD